MRRLVREICANYCTDMHVHIEGIDVFGDRFDLTLTREQAKEFLEDPNGLEDAVIEAEADQEKAIRSLGRSAA